MKSQTTTAAQYENLNTTRLYFTKEFTRGLLKGIVLNDSMGFTDPARAMLWLKGIAANHKRLNYVIIDHSFQKYWRD